MSERGSNMHDMIFGREVGKIAQKHKNYLDLLFTSLTLINGLIERVLKMYKTQDKSIVSLMTRKPIHNRCIELYMYNIQIFGSWSRVLFAFVRQQISSVARGRFLPCSAGSLCALVQQKDAEFLQRIHGGMKNVIQSKSFEVLQPTCNVKAKTLTSLIEFVSGLSPIAHGKFQDVFARIALFFLADAETFTFFSPLLSFLRARAAARDARKTILRRTLSGRTSFRLCFIWPCMH